MIQIEFDQEKIRAFCERHHIRKLSFFGSVLRDDFTPDSDVDVLVEFEEGTTIGLFGLTRIEREFSELLGRTVDLHTAGSLSKYFRDEVLREAEGIYATA
jgi:predicted nucleotidyltransferase